MTFRKALAGNFLTLYCETYKKLLKLALMVVVMIIFLEKKMTKVPSLHTVLLLGS